MQQIRDDPVSGFDRSMFGSEMTDASSLTAAGPYREGWFIKYGSCDIYPLPSKIGICKTDASTAGKISSRFKLISNTPSACV